MFFDVYNSYLIRNKLTFYKFNDSLNIDLGTENLRVLNLFLYKVDLDSDILHKQLFKTLYVLSIFNSLNRIERGLLTRRNFESLNEILFFLDNFKGMYFKGSNLLKGSNFALPGGLIY